MSVHIRFTINIFNHKKEKHGYYFIIKGNNENEKIMEWSHDDICDYIMKVKNNIDINKTSNKLKKSNCDIFDLISSYDKLNSVNYYISNIEVSDSRMSIGWRPVNNKKRKRHVFDINKNLHHTYTL